MAAPSSDRAAIRQVIRALKAAGYAPQRVHDGEWVEVTGASEADVIEAIEAIMAVDDATLVVVGNGHSGWVRFVMGNDPEEVVCDHTVDLNHVLDPLLEGWWS